MKSTWRHIAGQNALLTGLFLCLVLAVPIVSRASSLSEEVLNRTNNVRTERGAGSLTRNKLLDTAAAAKLNEMKKFSYFDHAGPSNKRIWDFIADAGYNYSFAGENLARGFKDANEIVAAWNKSPAHRENMLDKKFTEAGISSDGNYTVLVLAAPRDSGTASVFGGANVIGSADFTAVRPARMTGIMPFVLGALMVAALLMLDVVLLAKIHDEDINYPHLHHHFD